MKKKNKDIIKDQDGKPIEIELDPFNEIEKSLRKMSKEWMRLFRIS